MRCPNCEKELGSNETCPQCGMDAVIFTKMCATSDALYNKGLQRVRLNDLSGAIECLSKSIEFNRKSINARNLLGLVYFEMGELGEALRHWVISTSISGDNNAASGYIERIQARTRELDRYNDAIKMYNQALVYVRQKSEDMAIIQLRKAVDINPKFVIAMNLLAFCYLIQKEKEQAKVLIERVLAIDNNNAISLHYLIEIGTSRQRTETVPRAATPVRNVTMTQMTGGYTRLSTKDKKNFGTTFHIAQIIFFIIGGLCAVLFYTFMILPSMLETSENTIKRLKEEIAAASSDFESTKTADEEIISALEDEKADLERINSQLTESLALQEKIQQAYSIIVMYDAGLVEEAAESVYSFDTTGLPADVLEKLIEVKDQSFKQTAQTHYNEGARDYNARRYDDAKDRLSKALKFADPDVNFMPDVIYLLGRIAEQHDDDNDEAIRYYQMVVSNYPRSNRYNSAVQGVRRLSE